MSPTIGYNSHVNHDRYEYRVIWSEEDGEYIGLCTEFPSCSWQASSQGDALSGIKKLIHDIMKDMEKNGETIPAVDS